MPSKIIHSLGIKCHIPKMNLFKRHSWKICFFILLRVSPFISDKKSMVEAISYASKWHNCVSILSPNGERCFVWHCCKNYGSSCISNFGTMCRLHSFIWLVDVMCKLWHFCNGGELYWWCMASNSHNNWIIWGAKYFKCLYGKTNEGLLGSFGLLDKVIAYINADKGSNLASLTTILTLVVSCSSLKLVSPFVGSCFKHIMSKATQYAIDDSKVCQRHDEGEFQAITSGIPKDHSMSNEISKRVAGMERCLHSCMSSSPNIEIAHENMVCLACNTLPRNVSIPRCNFNLLW